MVHLISVAPTDDAWAVIRDGHPDMVFPTGGRAEDAARRLAAHLAREGHACEIRIFLKDGSLAGRFACPASASATACGG